MNQFFASGHAVDFVLLVLAAEVIFLSAGRDKSMERAKNVVSAAVPGVCLLLALRASLIGASWVWVAFWLVLSLPAHLLDIKRRNL